MRRHPLIWTASVVVLFLVAAGVFAAVRYARAYASAEADLQTCRMNLRMIGSALEPMFGPGGGTYPTGTVANPALPPEKRLSWLFTCMPYMLCPHCCGLPTEGLAVHGPWDATENRLWAVAPMYLLHCPGSPRQSPVGYQSAVNYVDLKAKTTIEPTPFIGIGGLGTDAPTLPVGDRRAGFFGYDRVIRPADIRDGMATTVAVVETSSLQGSWTAGGPATVRGLDPARLPYFGRGRQFGGNHPRAGKALALFADGSVRPIRETVDPKVFEALATIAGGEPVAPGWDR